MDDAIENYAAKLLAETREEIVRADTKVEILFAAFGWSWSLRYWQA
jgi:hypothetical protein